MSQNEVHSTGTQGTVLDRSACFDLLSSDRRVQVVKRLFDAGPTTLSTLTDEIAAEENDCEPDELTSKQRKRVYVSLYQTHLPKLDRFDVLAFDADTGNVRPGPELASLHAALEAVTHA